MVTKKIPPKILRIDILVLFLCFFIFFLDYYTPQGVADGMLYTIPLLVAWSAKSSRLILFIAALSTILIIAGYFISSYHIDSWIVVFNRGLSILTVSITGIIISRIVKLQLESEEQRKQLQMERVALERSNSQLDLYANTLAHDLHNPLRSVMGLSRILQEDYTQQLDDTGKESIQRIHATVTRMDEMITAIYNLSKLTTSELHKIRTDLSGIAFSVIDELRRQEPERTVDIKIQENLSAYCDPVLIRNVLQNLLGNAWKFTRKTSGSKIEFGRKSEAREVVYFVKDNGAGFDNRHAAKMFRIFQRLHSESEFEGTGTGLATVSKIIEKHGGKIWAEGETGKGACFYFTLPQ